LANIRLIRRRIRGIRNISKITRAMEMIAASKMRKAQERGLAGRPYSEKIIEVLSTLAATPSDSRAHHPLLEARDAVQNVAIIHITPDRGLTGGLVSNINRTAARFIVDQGIPVEVVAVGRKGLDFMRRTSQNVVADFVHLGDHPAYTDILPISRIIIEDFTSRKVDSVYVSYARFVSTGVQVATVQPILPIQPATLSTGSNVDYIFEPDPQSVLEALLPRFIETQIYHLVLEAIASEQSARMMAMRNATDNAEELTSDLTLVYNKARQESITTELLDIIGGATALTG
jgi:F-type H+-transporting ATPase subunit gamma